MPSKHKGLWCVGILYSMQLHKKSMSQNPCTSAVQTALEDCKIAISGTWGKYTI